MDSWKTLIEASVSLSPTNKVGKTLGLTVRGEEAKAGWRFPTIRYSINRVVLHFEANECLFPEEDWAFDTTTLAELEISQEISESGEMSNAMDSGWSGAISVSASKGSVKASRSRSTKKAVASSSRFSTKHRPILAHGTAANPKWSLTSEQIQKPLLGTLIKHDRFCRAEPSGPKPKVSVSFEIPYDALLFKRTDGSFVPGNKFGIVRLLFRASICERKHSLCEMEL
ncbi:hypothetical protein [Mesorhizobium sanjuanii]|uniref:hypothetical protein n=1 Tax=Mesorhizobium sanjuanii TaxID=2037900 RepID=UPI0010554AA0|nr:hypothetical protein [Mesorhizobium sanjuanii]